MHLTILITLVCIWHWVCAAWLSEISIEAIAACLVPYRRMSPTVALVRPQSGDESCKAWIWDITGAVHVQVSFWFFFLQTLHVMTLRDCWHMLDSHAVPDVVIDDIQTQMLRHVYKHVQTPRASSTAHLAPPASLQMDPLVTLQRVWGPFMTKLAESERPVTQVRVIYSNPLHEWQSHMQSQSTCAWNPQASSLACMVCYLAQGFAWGC